MQNRKYAIGCNYSSRVKNIVSVLTILVLLSVCAVTFFGCKLNHEIPEGIYNATEGSFRYSEKGTKTQYFLKVKGNYVTEFLSGLGTKMKIITKDEKIYFQEEKMMV